MRRIYWQKRLNDFSRFWLNPSTTQHNPENSPLLLTERLEDRIVLAAPVAMDDMAMTDEDTSVNINVLSNDSDPDLDMLSVIEINGTAFDPMNGNTIALTSGATVSLNMDGTLDYDPGTAFDNLAVTDPPAVDSFDYTISDGNGGTAIATVNLTIVGLNDPPVGTDQMQTISENEVNSDLNISNLFSDVDDSTLIYSINGMALTPGGSAVDLGDGVTVTLNIDGSLTYNPGNVFDSLAFGETDNDSYTIQAVDSQNAMADATVTITINGTNDDPVITNGDDTASLDETNAGLMTTGTLTV
ncbi:MAG: Ig-like domain-containing protein, partial [Planctomycetaceae bacterium]|nr:Ig-like domain-containing protein [Planctomycetaceae bacterium]